MYDVNRLRAILLRAALVLGLAWVLAVPVGAARAETMNLEQCLERALAESLAVKQAQADTDVARFQLKEAKTGFFPTLKTTYSYTRLDEAPSISFAGTSYPYGTVDNFNWEVTLTQPLFMGFRVLTSQKLAELGLKGAELGEELARLDLALQVKQAYFSVLLAQKQTEVADQAIKQLEAGVDVAKNFFEVGMIPKNDLLQVEVELANAVQVKVNAENSVSLAKARLNTLLRQNIETPWSWRTSRGSRPRSRSSSPAWRPPWPTGRR